jgi:hypothetical protein
MSTLLSEPSGFGELPPDITRLAKRIGQAQREAEQMLLPGLVFKWHVFPEGASGAEVLIASTQRDALALADVMINSVSVARIVCIRRVIDPEASS